MLNDFLKDEEATMRISCIPCFVQEHADVAAHGFVVDAHDKSSRTPMCQRHIHYEHLLSPLDSFTVERA